jgi:CO/xanthine dehydrogenase Mo-binding subunit
MRRSRQSARHQLAEGDGLVGVAAAIANAIYRATGKRMRDRPITIDKLQR